MEKKQVGRYLFWAFLLAWLLQGVAIYFARQGQLIGFQMVLALSMYAPFAAVLLAGIPLRGMGWRPRLKGKFRWFLAAWLGSAVLMVLGAALYFLVFPASLDLSGSTLLGTMEEAAQEQALAQLEASGMSLRTLVLIQVLGSLLWAPFVNTFLALGEEVGWRGALYPRLKARFGPRAGLLLGGAIWGIWHWPVMILAGYNYGTQYLGAPLLGPLLFCVVTVAVGTLIDLLYEKTACIWIPALAHGAFNATAAVPTIFLAPAYASQTILGPTMIGAIGGLPMLALGFWLVLRRGAEKA